MLNITAINGHDLTKCMDEERGNECKNSYPCKVENELKCGVGCENSNECDEAFRENTVPNYRDAIMNTFLRRENI